MNRRGFITGMGAVLAAPAIVRASSLMPIVARPEVMTLPILDTGAKRAMWVTDLKDGVMHTWYLGDATPWKCTFEVALSAIKGRAK